MSHPRSLRAAVATAVLATASAITLATPEAPAFRSDAITTDEIAALNRAAGDYSTKFVMAAKGSGAWLSDVDVTVRSLPGRDTVLETRTEGPLLLVDLAPGRYEVSASYADVREGAPNTVKRTLVVPTNGHTQVVLQFDTSDRVSRP